MTAARLASTLSISTSLLIDQLKIGNLSQKHQQRRGLSQRCKRCCCEVQQVSKANSSTKLFIDDDFSVITKG